MASRAKKEPIKPLSPRIHINEFLKLHAQLGETQQAGFRVYCKKDWMRREEWQDCLNTYLSR